MSHWIIETGLTRRLVEADDEAAAVSRFKYETPMRSVLLLAADDLQVHEATEEEIAEFQRSRKSRPIEGQTALDLGDPVLTPKERKAAKEHA